MIGRFQLNAVFTYKATNTLNGKFYVGSTTDLERRKREHLACTRNYPFQNALRKNPDAFEWEVYEDDSDEPILEQALLDAWFGTEVCYNLNPLASRPPVLRGEDHPMFGVPKSAESKERNREAHLGKKMSKETKELMSSRKKGENNHMYGKGGESSPGFGKSWWVNKSLDLEAFTEECPGHGWEPGRKQIREETSEKISQATAGEKNPMFGRTGEESTAWGKVWWVNKQTNEEKLEKDCPGPEWVEGRKKKSKESREKLRKANTGKKWWVSENGDTTFRETSPGEGWVEGRKWKVG